MLMKRLLLGSLVAASLAGASMSASARTNVDLVVNFGPPPLRYEVVPAPRVGFVWVPGYWDWRYHRHYWVAGHWVRHRPGYLYEPARWIDRGGNWYYHRAAWRPWDRDGDGIPNRYDRHPDNPYRP